LIIRDGPSASGNCSAIGRITQKEPTQHLREFEDPALVARAVYAEVPLPVESPLADRGNSFRTPLATLVRWSIRRGKP